MKNRRKAVQPFEIKKRKIDIFRNYEANGFEKNQRKFENFSTLISKKSTVKSHLNSVVFIFEVALAFIPLILSKYASEPETLKLVVVTNFAHSLI